MDDDIEYFNCDCVYHRNCYILCELCKKIMIDNGFIKIAFVEKRQTITELKQIK